jgi:hypothetical protein
MPVSPIQTAEMIAIPTLFTIRLKLSILSLGGFLVVAYTGEQGLAG